MWLSKLLKRFDRKSIWDPQWPTYPCKLIVAEIVDDYTPLHLQSERYIVDFDPTRLYETCVDFGSHENPRVNGVRKRKRLQLDSGFYPIEVISDEKEVMPSETG